MAHILLLNSGGLDSLYCAQELSAAGHTLHSVFVSLGNTADADALASAIRISNQYCATHRTLQIKGLVPRQYTNATFVGIPYQTMILFTIAASLATSTGLRFVASGVKWGVMGYTPQKVQELLSQSFLTTWDVTFLIPAGTLTPMEVWMAVKDNPLAPLVQSCNLSPSCFEVNPNDRSLWCPKCRFRDIYGID